ncbi:MAG: porin family protein [Flavobacterium sp.]
MNLRHFTLLMLLMWSLTTLAQDEIHKQEGLVQLDSIPETADPLYREDQIYASLSYNLLLNGPGDYKQNSVSTAFSVGLLRDFPVNKARTYAIAAGLGYAYTNIKHNLLVTDTPLGPAYSIENEDTFDRNKLVLQYLELPIEFRWRNSTPTDHKFWRVYLGFKVSYLVNDKAQVQDFAGTGSRKVKEDNNLNKWVYGTYISAGWNTWNLYAYYGLSPIYDGAVTDTGEKVNLNSLKLGLIFYIL